MFGGKETIIVCLFAMQIYDDKEREEGEKNGDKKQVFKYSAESDLAVQLLNDLKHRCAEQKDKVRQHSC